MAVKTFNTRIKLKNDTSVNWGRNSDNTGLVLLAGEFAFDTTKKNFFIGDGTTSTKTLPYIIGAAVMADYTALGSGVTPVAITSSMTLNEALANLQGQVSEAAQSGVTSIDNHTGTFQTSGYITTESVPAEGQNPAYTAIVLDENTIDHDYNAGGTYYYNHLATVDTVMNALETLDGVITGTPGAGKTPVAFSQTDGVVTASFADISITASQVSDLSTWAGSNAVTSIQGDGTYLEPSTATTGAVTISHKTSSFAAASGTANMIPGGSFTNKVLSYDGAGHINGENTTTYTLQTVDVASASATGFFADAKETKDYVDAAINRALDSEVTFMGVTSTLPASPDNGDLWKVGGDIIIPAASAASGVQEKAVIGDAIIYKYDDTQGATGNGWYVIPSGDESFADTWRPISVNGTQLLGNGINTGSVNFEGANDNPVVVGSGANGTVKIEHDAITTPSSGTDTAKSQGDSVTVMTGISGDSYGHVTGYTTNTFTVPVVNTHSLSIGTENAYNTYNPSVQGSTNQIVTIAGSGPISAVSSTGSATTITISHDGPGTNGADITAVTTASALKVAYDAKGHITSSAALTATDITCTEAVYGSGSSTSNTQTALTNLASAVGSISIGTLNTDNASAQATSSSESFSGTINLHKISKTASTDDLIQGLTILLDCGSATTVIDVPTGA